MKKLSIYSIFLISLLVNYGYTLKTPSAVEIENYYGDMMFLITEDNSEETSFKCVAQNKPEPSGKFQWTIGGEIVKSASDPDEITATGDEISTFIYTPKVEDNDKQLKCVYLQEENGQMSKTSSETEIVFRPISKQILPKSPFKLTEIFEVGSDAEIKLNLELFPGPDYDNYRWVIETDQTLELPSDQSTDKYESKLKEASDGQYQYEALLIIKNWQETDAESKYFFKVVNADGEKRIDIELPKPQVSKPTEITVPTENTTTTPEPATGLGIGIYIIISLVVLIVLACIGYCIWQKYFREKEPEPKTQDAEKGDYNAVPKSDPDQSVPPSK